MAQCLHPILIRNPTIASRELSNGDKKFLSQEQYAKMIEKDPTLAYRSWLHVPCGKCLECRRNRRTSWRSRLLAEYYQAELDPTYPKVVSNGCLVPAVYFITLTIRPEVYEKVSCDPAPVIRRWLDDFRKHYGRRFRYCIIPEYGDAEHHTGRLHFHGLLFGMRIDYTTFFKYSRRHFGRCDIQLCRSAAVCSYVSKYISKAMLCDPNTHERPCTSRLFVSRGFGLAFVRDHTYVDRSSGAASFCIGDRSYPCPRYVYNRITSEDFRRDVLARRLLDLFGHLERGDTEVYKFGNIESSSLDYILELRSRLYQSTFFTDN